MCVCVLHVDFDEEEDVRFRDWVRVSSGIVGYEVRGSIFI